MAHPYRQSVPDNQICWRDGKLYMHGRELNRSEAPSGSTVTMYPSSHARGNHKSGSVPEEHEPSQTKQRATTGLPNTLFGGASQASAPAYGADQNDPFRDALSNRRRAPIDSRFARDSAHYHRLDAKASSYGGQYNAFKRTAETQGKHGQPRVTREWYDQLGDIARHSAQLYQDAADARQKMAHDYIAYEGKKSAEGHQKRIKILQEEAKRMSKKEELHHRGRERRA
ncbi:hypothetical protein PRK78_001655 [Emydomyces testavorans]|uniref:Uncharacterized protein n=1 Tax=Emydomyces testavorans TaxID=2070801 RepID=A0AAF0IH30_9EURO|nr:hypothetical protein PRK78_001655 [Emydomyces testavorans]